MMNNRAWLLPALLLLAALPAFSLGSQEPPAPAAAPQTEQTAAPQTEPGDGEETDSMELNVGDTVELRGRLRVVGNEPFTQLVLTLESPASDDQSGSYAIMDAFHDELMQRQQQIVSLRAEIIARPQAGMPGAIEVREILEE